VKLDAAIKPPEGMAGRFFRTGYLPTFCTVVFLLVLVWAGAPAKRVHFGDAWQTANNAGVVEILLIFFTVVLVSVLLQPLQLSLVRLLEGGWPRWLGSGLALRWQLYRKHRRERAVQKMVDQAAGTCSLDSRSNERESLVQRAGAATSWLRSRFPPQDFLVRPTALGNVLAATEDNAGVAYGLDAVVMWPRMYPLVSDQTRAVVDDLRDGMDGAARWTATGAVTAVATVGLLAWHSGWWMLLALAPLAVSVLAYSGAVRAATAYGLAIHVAFDLHRFELHKAMRLAVPDSHEAEGKANRALSDFLRQGVPVPFSYTDSRAPVNRDGQ
jgi:hypothetical protein